MLGRSTLNQLVQGTADRQQYTTLLSVCWALTIVSSIAGGGLFMLLAVLSFIEGRADLAGAASAMACAYAVVPYVVSRAFEGFGRAGRLAEALDERRRTRETAP